MKVNRITFDKLKAQHELLKMKAAYVLAEEFLMNKEAKELGNEDVTWTFTTTSTPEQEWEMYASPKKPMTEKEIVHEQLLVLEKQLSEAEELEQYESCEALLEAIKLLRRKFINL